MAARIEVRDFGTSKDGKQVDYFTLDNGNGCVIGLCGYGATISSVRYADRDGKIDEVNFGFDDLASYEAHTSSMGVTVGRYANRIRNAQFTLNGEVVRLDVTNEAGHSAHGGSKGFGKQVFSGEIVETAQGKGVKFTYISADGEGGYPGELTLSVTYCLSDDGVLRYVYDAICSKDTFINITNHAYFNLDGLKADGSTNVAEHEIKLNSGFITPLDADSVCTGEVKPVGGTAFDLRQQVRIGDGLDSPHELMKATNGGYDISYILGADDGIMKDGAYVYSAKSGRAMQVKTTQPCLQFYTNANLRETLLRDGKKVNKMAGFCLEAQDYPNGPNVAHFPTEPLRAGQKYQQVIEYIFTTEA
ncbi:MAG: galactose-1-epimerase [Hyphomicrobiales bacterium]|nr:MAG: galactose-1-epimerase [Hyphomicrobiales bacterium]